MEIGESEKLTEISIGLDELKKMEENLSKKISPTALKQDISGIILILSGVTIFLLVIVLKYCFRKYQKLRSRRVDRQEMTEKKNEKNEQEPYYLEVE